MSNARRIKMRGRKKLQTLKYPGFTLTEVIIASLLLAIAMVPILKALTGAHRIDTKIERRMRSLNLARAKLEDIRARSIYNYDTDFNESNTNLEGRYLCKIGDEVAAQDLRSISVRVGYDENDNADLGSDEVEARLDTLLARRW